MNSNNLHNLKNLVDFGYCIGCGLCVGICKNSTSKMILNKYGLYEPKLTSDCLSCVECNNVCPFGYGVVKPSSELDENQIFEQRYDTSQCDHNDFLGYFRKCYVGYSSQYRLSGSSGGLATWLLSYMLQNDIIDKVICVTPTGRSDIHFEYKISSHVEEIISASKSHYYPVHLADLLKMVIEDNHRYSIIGLPCFIKGIRLAQKVNQNLAKNIQFTIGLFCGGMKSRFFTEYLAGQLGIPKDKIINPKYRIKHEGPSSQGYYFGLTDPNNLEKNLELNVKKFGDLWGPGYFKPKACDYCDDVTAEVADISLGDAWIKPYLNDWKGHSIVIVRTELAEQIITNGIKTKEIILEDINPDYIVKSQLSNFNHRRKGLSYRLYWNQKQIVPKKRVNPKKPKNIIDCMIYRLKSKIRERSLEVWYQVSQNGTNLSKFNNEMFPYIYILKILNFISKRLAR